MTVFFICILLLKNILILDDISPNLAKIERILIYTELSTFVSHGAMSTSILTYIKDFFMNCMLNTQGDSKDSVQTLRGDSTHQDKRY